MLSLEAVSITPAPAPAGQGASNSSRSTSIVQDAADLEAPTVHLSSADGTPQCALRPSGCVRVRATGKTCAQRSSSVHAATRCFRIAMDGVFYAGTPEGGHAHRRLVLELSIMPPYEEAALRL